VPVALVEHVQGDPGIAAQVRSKTDLTPDTVWRRRIRGNGDISLRISPRSSRCAWGW